MPERVVKEPRSGRRTRVPGRRCQDEGARTKVSGETNMRQRCSFGTFRLLNRLHLLLIGTLLCLQAGFEGPSPADEVPPAVKEALEKPSETQPEKTSKQPDPIGQFLTISGTVDDAMYGKVNRTALALQARAQLEKRKGVLVLEILPGSSRFGQ